MIIDRAPKWLYKTTIKEFEQQLKELPKPEIISIPRDDFLNKEHKGLLSFADVFDDCCRYLKQLPTQDFYAGYYVGQLMCKDGRQKSWPHGIELRAKRNYMSFVREYHLFVMLKKGLPEYKIIFDSDYDNIGIDFVLAYQGKNLLGICSYIGTTNSFYNLHRKRAKRNELLLIELPLYPQDAKKTNGFWLYDYKKHIVPLKNQIAQLINTA